MMGETCKRCQQGKQGCPTNKAFFFPDSVTTVDRDRFKECVASTEPVKQQRVAPNSNSRGKRKATSKNRRTAVIPQIRCGLTLDNPDPPTP
jgi:hypothetical protein